MLNIANIGIITIMIDIHSHIIYGVDDGSRCLDESLKMIEIYISNGFNKVVATSHYDIDRYMVKSCKIREKVKILNEEIDKRGLDFKIYPGHEIQFHANMIDNLRNGIIQTLNNSRYILFELPFSSKPIYLKDLIYEIQLEGFTPIIAHAERYDYLSLSFIRELINIGCLIQVNYSSIDNSYKKMKRMLEDDLVHIIATDSHQAEWRSPDISLYKDKILAIIGLDKFKELSLINPNKVINDEFIKIDYEKNEKVKRKKSIFNFWRRK